MRGMQVSEAIWDFGGLGGMLRRWVQTRGGYESQEETNKMGYIGER